MNYTCQKNGIELMLQIVDLQPNVEKRVLVLHRKAKNLVAQ